MIVTRAILARQAPPFIKPKKVRGAKYQGIRYEKKVQAHLLEKYDEHYIDSPWIVYWKKDSGRKYWCQPDGLLIFPEEAKIIICEIKYSHTLKAKQQLFGLYLPVIRSLFSDSWDIRCCEIVKWIDPHDTSAKEVKMREQITDSAQGCWNVHILYRGM